MDTIDQTTFTADAKRFIQDMAMTEMETADSVIKRKLEKQK